MKKITEILQLCQNKNYNSILVHCITNPISINQCANIVIAAGANPIMAEHPDEVAEITKMSDALLINTGNITDTRMKSFKISANTANNLNIPIIIDIVGASCSTLRLNYIKNFLKDYKVDIIKGNMSEIKALLGYNYSSHGIDVSENDKINDSNLKNSVLIAKNLAQKYNTTVMITGKYDIIADFKSSFVIRNGNSNLSKLTGTGCMLGALTAVYMKFLKSLNAAILACVYLSIAGDNSIYKGPESYLSDILDNIYSLSPEILEEKADIIEYRS